MIFFFENLQNGYTDLACKNQKKQIFILISLL